MPPCQIDPTKGGSSRLLTIARSQDAQLCAVRTNLAPAEESHLRAVLDLLVEMGAIALYNLDTAAEPAASWTEMIALLQKYVGRFCTNAAVDAAVYAATPTPKPHTLVPVWSFERLPGDPDALIASGIFMGAPITFEALPLCDADVMKPASAVADRYGRWRAAAGRQALLGTVAIRGQHEAHAVFASVRGG